MTEKGYYFLRSVAEKYKFIISLVVIGSDKSVKKDFSEEMINFCVVNGIKFIKKEEFNSISSEFVIAIGCR